MEKCSERIFHLSICRFVDLYSGCVVTHQVAVHDIFHVMAIRNGTQNVSNDSRGGKFTEMVLGLCFFHHPIVEFPSRTQFRYQINILV